MSNETSKPASTKPTLAPVSIPAFEDLDAKVTVTLKKRELTDILDAICALEALERIMADSAETRHAESSMVLKLIHNRLSPLYEIC